MFFDIRTLLMSLLWTGSIVQLSMYAMEKNIQQPIYAIIARLDAEEFIKSEKKTSSREFVGSKFIFKRKATLSSASDLENEYKQRLERYAGYEATYSKAIKESPLASVFGGINYAMTLNEMEQAIKEKFNAMKKNGLIISEDEFKKIEENYFEVPTQDLTRVWGTEYLKNKINESERLLAKYDVPNYVIVADNPNHMKIKLSFGNKQYPLPSELENGKIYFTKIVGVGVAKHNSEAKKDIGIESGIGFDDFSSSGNILEETKSGKWYIVDTEKKSFAFPMDIGLVILLDYAAKKFKYLNNNLWNYIYDFDLES